MREITTCTGEKWEQMSTEELDRILQEELRKEHPDENVVLPILREIESREKDIPAGDSAEVSQLRDKLSEHSTPTKRRPRNGWVAGIAAVAAAACIVVMAVPRTVGAESIIDVLFRWTSSIFEFVNPDSDESKPQIDAEFVTDNSGLQQLYDKLTELGVTESVVPMWLPEGSNLLKLDVRPLPDGHKISAVFQQRECVISFTYRIYAEKTSKFEKEDSAIEVFESAGIDHFILDNDANLTAMWGVEDVECSLNTNLTREEVYEIIKSIYRSKLS